MSVFAALSDYLATMNQRRRYVRTERTIRSLPVEIQKDIGWPGVAQGVDRYPRDPEPRWRS